MPYDAADMPRMSVIIAMRDAAATLADELEALTHQTYAGWWEVILADNGSVDASCDVGRSFEGRLPNLRVISAAERPGCATHATSPPASRRATSWPSATPTTW